MRGNEFLDKLELLSPELIQSAMEPSAGLSSHKSSEPTVPGEMVEATPARRFPWLLPGVCACALVCITLALAPVLFHGDREPAASSPPPPASPAATALPESTGGDGAAVSPSPTYGVEPGVVEWIEGMVLEDYFQHSIDPGESALWNFPGEIHESSGYGGIFFSTEREQLEQEEVIPKLDHTLNFTCAGFYSENASIPKSLSLLWHSSRQFAGSGGVREDYLQVQTSDLSTFVSSDDFSYTNRTVVRRDGVDIVVLGRARGDKRFVFRREGVWYQISATEYIPSEDVLATLDHWFSHTMNFNRFPRESGRAYAWATLEEYPWAFAGYYPLGDTWDTVPPLQTAEVLLEDDRPVRLVCDYERNAEDKVLMGWTVYLLTPENQPDAYFHYSSAGMNLYDLTPESLQKYWQRSAMTFQHTLCFYWDGYVVEANLFPDTTPEQAWPLVQQLQENAGGTLLNRMWEETYAAKGYVRPEPESSISVHPDAPVSWFIYISQDEDAPDMGDVEKLTPETVREYLARPEVQEKEMLRFRWSGYHIAVFYNSNASAEQIYGFLQSLPVMEEGKAKA